ncbi:hypothetical protein [Streptomyces pseudogriseolus]|uniref:hypothetical protein n=1 Tax=Streptomyces pseudogriseolus TaxID=36817 RepID=UPI003FA26B9C
MLNNQIIITDGNVCPRAKRNDKGVIDAAQLTPSEWEELRSRNANSTKAKLVKCAKCWQLYQSEQWLKTFNRLGTRVISHQPGEQRPDHDYDPVETAEHRAYNERAFLIGEAEGYNPRKEAWAPNRKTRADVLLTGTVTIAYEHQHSPFSTGRYSAPERTRLAGAVGRTAMWHATNDKVRGQVPILRTDGGLPPKVILNPNYRHEFRGGIYRIEIYTCTVREGHECPNRKFSGCGKPHARGQVKAGQLDDVLRGAPVGAYVPVVNASVVRAPKFFWTDRQSYDQYLAYIAGPGALLGSPPAMQGRVGSGARRGHSRAKEAELAALEARAVILSPGAGVTSAVERQAAGACDTGQPLCGKPARFYAAGWRCDKHKPSSYWISS